MLQHKEKEKSKNFTQKNKTNERESQSFFLYENHIPAIKFLNLS